MDQKVRKRKEWVDFLRGIAMLMVIWGHVDKTNHLFFVVTSPFKIPLFFAITGYIFKDRDGNVKEFLYKQFISLIIPWIVLSLIWLKLIYVIAIGRTETVHIYLLNFISGKDFWFMPCVIIANILFFFIRKLIVSVHLQYVIMIIISCGGVFINQFTVARYAMISVACTVQLFYLFGYWFKNNEEMLRKYVSNVMIVMMILVYIILIVISLAMYPKQYIDVHNGRYYNYLLCMAMVFLSLMILFIVVPNISYFLRWVLFVGQNTIVFYICHYHARSLLTRGTRLLKISIPDNFVGYSLKFIYICTLMSILTVLINKYTPFILGRKKIRN